MDLRRVLVLRPHLTRRMCEVRQNPHLILEPTGATQLLEKGAIWTRLDDRLPFAASQSYWQLCFPDEDELPGRLLILPGLQSEGFEWAIVAVLIEKKSGPIRGPLDISAADEFLDKVCAPLVESNFFAARTTYAFSHEFIFAEHDIDHAMHRDEASVRSLISRTLTQLNLSITRYNWRVPSLMPEAVVVPVGPAHFALGDLWISLPWRKSRQSASADLLLPHFLSDYGFWATAVYKWAPSVEKERERAVGIGERLIGVLGSPSLSVSQLTQLGRDYSAWLRDWVALYHHTRKAARQIRSYCAWTLASKKGLEISVPVFEDQVTSQSFLSVVEREVAETFSRLEDDLERDDRYIRATSEHLEQTASLVLGEANLGVQSALLRLTWVLTILTVILLGISVLLAMENPSVGRFLREIADLF